MSDARVLLANEAGAGRGHLTLLAQVAHALGPGFSSAAAIPRPRYAAELSAQGIDVVPGPRLRYTRETRANPELAGNATWGDYLAASGLGRDEIVRHHLRWWRDKIVEEDATVLIADYAPLAIWAARGLKAEGWDIEILSVGTGYGLPPARLDRFPQLLPDYSRQVVTEAETLAVLNRVAGEMGLSPLPSLPSVAAADCELAFTLPHLDPYDRPREDRFAPVLAPLPPPATGEGGELFVYFSWTELKDPALVKALASLPIPRRGYLPGAPAEALDRLRSGGMVVEDRPLSIAEITARSRLVFGAGTHGMICLCALAGLPMVALPAHLEQLCHCRSSQDLGVLRYLPFDRRSPGDIADTILAAWGDPGLSRAATHLAQDLRRNYPVDPMASLSDRLAPLAERARTAYR